MVFGANDQFNHRINFNMKNIKFTKDKRGKMYGLEVHKETGLLRFVASLQFFEGIGQILFGSTIYN